MNKPYEFAFPSIPLVHMKERIMINFIQFPVRMKNTFLWKGDFQNNLPILEETKNPE